MNKRSDSKKKQALKKAFAAMLALFSGSAGQAALAQGLDNGPLSGDDSYLPPEVVPLDPSAAGKLMQSQAQARAAQLASPELQSSPMVTGDPLGGMQTAQDARKAAYDQLMNQSQAMPSNRAYQNQYQPSMGQPAQGMPGMTNPYAYQGQPMANNYAGPTGPAAGTGQSGWMQSGAGGQQTLTGGVKYTQQRRDIRRAGFSNAMSAIAGLGTGLFLGSLVNRSYYSNPVGIGMLGLGMTGFGVRNGFRF